MYWRDMFPFFSRKEIVQLQLCSRFFVSAAQKVNIGALHVIDNLFISRSEVSNTFIFAMCKYDSVGMPDQMTRIADFCPPDYVRFSDVTLCLFLDADLLQLLQAHKIVFSGCTLWFIPIFINQESANEAFNALMEHVFTGCREINLNFDGWNSASQLNICSPSGMQKCDILHLKANDMILGAEDPFLESIFEWLHSNTKTGKKELMMDRFEGCEPLLRKLIQKFPDEMEPHQYQAWVSNLDGDFLNDFWEYSARNPKTQEELIADLEEDGDYVGFRLRRGPIGSFEEEE
ncbi:hypothetical protein Ddc_03774 [Ditylenchus destructor]|nr:hypothetical protein Ddc_03774 [Ditylenchus destructor]